MEEIEEAEARDDEATDLVDDQTDCCLAQLPRAACRTIWTTLCCYEESNRVCQDDDIPTWKCWGVFALVGLDAVISGWKRRAAAKREKIVKAIEEEPNQALYLVCEFLSTKELGIAQCVSWEWRGAALRRCQYLLTKKHGQRSETLNPITSNKLLHQLEKEDLVPEWVRTSRRWEIGGNYCVHCPKLGHMVMQLVKHSKNVTWDMVRRDGPPIEISPRDGLGQHPFGKLQMGQQHPNTLYLYLKRDGVVTAGWWFYLNRQGWYLDQQYSPMNEQYRICSRFNSAECESDGTPIFEDSLA